MEVPQGLLEAAERKLAKLEPMLDESGWIELGFVEEQNPRIADKYHCEIVAHLKGKRLKVEGSAGEPFAALDQATGKVDKQVRRLKDKRVRKRQRGNGAGVDAARVAGGGDIEHVLDAEPGSGGITESDGSDESDAPAIVDVREADGKPMTPVEAAMQLELRGQEFLLFQNAENGRAAVVYRRRDGDYGLVEVPG